MALFDRNQGRDRGYRGGYDRDLGGRMRPNYQARGYGADYGTWGGRDMSPTEAGWRGGGMNRGGMNPGRYDLSRGENFDVEGRWGAGGYDREMRGGGGYDRAFRARPDHYGSDYGATGPGQYGRGVGNDPGFPRDRGYGYDRHEYKSRQQTDAGDPFGDRQNRTPIRMVNEDYGDRLARRNAYDADVRRDRDWF